MTILGRELLSEATTTTTGATFPCYGSTTSVQASITGSGAISATVIVEVSNDESQWLTLETLSLSGTTSATGGVAFVPCWRAIRARLTAISGASAAVTVKLCG